MMTIKLNGHCSRLSARGDWHEKRGGGQIEESKLNYSLSSIPLIEVRSSFFGDSTRF
jgi:hypothetical protein